jgi:hypothetical protein
MSSARSRPGVAKNSSAVMSDRGASMTPSIRAAPGGGQERVRNIVMRRA